MKFTFAAVALVGATSAIQLDVAEDRSAAGALAGAALQGLATGIGKAGLGAAWNAAFHDEIAEDRSAAGALAGAALQGLATGLGKAGLGAAWNAAHDEEEGEDQFWGRLARAALHGAIHFASHEEEGLKEEALF